MPPLDTASSRAVRADPAPAVDVGIPTCGRPSYPVEAVESVLAQTLAQRRLTVSEDGRGSDAVAAAVAPYLSDPRVRDVVTGQRLGAGRHMTHLIRTGSAPYVGLLHDDDRWGPRFLGRRGAFLDANAACGSVARAGSPSITGAGARPDSHLFLRVPNP
jgi:GT2 family glycosyltransferase